MTTRSGIRFQDDLAGGSPTSVNTDNDDLLLLLNDNEDVQEEEIVDDNNEINNVEDDNVGDDQVPVDHMEMLNPFGEPASPLTDYGDNEHLSHQSDQGSDGAVTGAATQAGEPDGVSIQDRMPSQVTEPHSVGSAIIYDHYIGADLNTVRPDQWERTFQRAFNQLPEEARRRITDSNLNGMSRGDQVDMNSTSTDNRQRTRDMEAGPSNKRSQPQVESSPTPIPRVNKGKQRSTQVESISVDNTSKSKHVNQYDGVQGQQSLKNITNIQTDIDEELARQLHGQYNPLIPGYQHNGIKEDRSDPNQVNNNDKVNKDGSGHPYTLPDLKELREFTPSERLLPPKIERDNKASAEIPTDGYLAIAFKEDVKPNTKSPYSDKRMQSLKLKQPPAYDGIADYDTYEKWAFEVNLWFELQQFPTEHRTSYLGCFLSGKAAKWHMTFVAPDASAYTLPKLGRELFEYCFPPRLRSDMRTKFENATQGSRPLKEFIQYLTTLSKRVPDLTERNIALRLWNGAQPFIRNKWAEGGYDSELSPLIELELSGLRFEVANRLLNAEHGKGKSNSIPTRTTSDVRQRGSRNDNNHNKNSAEPNGWRNKSNFNRQSKFVPGKGSGSRNRSQYGQTGSSYSKNLPNKPAQNGSFKKDRPNSASRHDTSRPSKDELRAEGKCFTCYQPGHLTRDCPRKNTLKYTRPQVSMMAMQILRRESDYTPSETVIGDFQSQQGSSVITADTTESSGLDGLDEQIDAIEIEEEENGGRISVTWFDSIEESLGMNVQNVTIPIKEPAKSSPPAVAETPDDTGLLRTVGNKNTGIRPITVNLLLEDSDYIYDSIFEPRTLYNKLDESLRLDPRMINNQVGWDSWGFSISLEQITILDARVRALSFMGHTNWYTDHRAYVNYQRVIWARTHSRILLFDRFTGFAYPFFIEGFFDIPFARILQEFAFCVSKVCKIIGAKGPNDPIFGRIPVAMSRIFQVSDMWRRRVWDWANSTARSLRDRSQFEDVFHDVEPAPGHPDRSDPKLFTNGPCNTPSIYHLRFLNRTNVKLLQCDTFGIETDIEFSKIVPRHRAMHDGEWIKVEDALHPYVHLIRTEEFYQPTFNHVEALDSLKYIHPERQSLPKFNTWLSRRSKSPYFHQPDYSPKIANHVPTYPGMKLVLDNVMENLNMMANRSQTLSSMTSGERGPRFRWIHDGYSLPFILDRQNNIHFELSESYLCLDSRKLLEILENRLGPFPPDPIIGLHFSQIEAIRKWNGQVRDNIKEEIIKTDNDQTSAIDPVFGSAVKEEDNTGDSKTATNPPAYRGSCPPVSEMPDDSQDITEVHPALECICRRLRLDKRNDKYIQQEDDLPLLHEEDRISTCSFRVDRRFEFVRNERDFIRGISAGQQRLISRTQMEWDSYNMSSASPPIDIDPTINSIQDLNELSLNELTKDLDERIPKVVLESNGIFIQNKINQQIKKEDNNISIMSELTSEIIYEDTTEYETDSDMTDSFVGDEDYRDMPSLVSVSDSEDSFRSDRRSDGNNNSEQPWISDEDPEDIDLVSTRESDTSDSERDWDSNDDFVFVEKSTDKRKSSANQCEDKPQIRERSTEIICEAEDPEETREQPASKRRKITQLEVMATQVKTKALRPKKKPNRKVIARVPITTEVIPKFERNASKPKDEKRLVPLHMTVQVKMNGNSCEALIDSGSLSDMISTTLVDQLNIPKIELDEPLIYNLAASGSKTKVQYYAMIEIQVQEVKETRRFDIMNTETHDVILGTPFLFQHSICLGFNPFSLDIGSAEQKPIKGREVAMIETLMVTMEMEAIDIARQTLIKESKDLCKSAAETPLPPMRAINHTIPIIDETKVYSVKRYGCPEKFKPEWRAKRDAYINSGRWRYAVGHNASPMLFVHKKPGPDGIAKLRTVFDKREINDNTRKKASPLPNMETILSNVLRHKFRSLIDGKDAYEQIWIDPESVKHSLFTTPDGTMESLVIQQGDCNGGATYQALMNHIFAPYIGVFMDVYLDDIIIYSDSIKDHVKHVQIIIDILRREKLYLTSSDKLQFFAQELKILGHVIDEDGLIMDPHKVDSIQNWKVPTSKSLLASFLGAVGYLAPNCKGIRTPMAPLTKISGATSKWRWTETQQRAFEDVKKIVNQWRNNHRRAIDYSSDAPRVNLICDASLTGAGGTLSQGDNPLNADIIAFWSAKFNPAQQNYAVHERELLAIIEALKRFRYLLQGIKFRVYTDHKPLEFLMTQPKLSARQQRWMDEISNFDFEISYVPGEKNTVADALSRIYSEEPKGTVRSTSEMIDEKNVKAEQIVSGGLSIFSLSAPIYTGPAASTRSKSRTSSKESNNNHDSGDNDESNKEVAIRRMRTRTEAGTIRKKDNEWDHASAAVLPLTSAARDAIVNKTNRRANRRKKSKKIDISTEPKKTIDGKTHPNKKRTRNKSPSDSDSSSMKLLLRTMDSNNDLPTQTTDNEGIEDKDMRDAREEDGDLRRTERPRTSGSERLIERRSERFDSEDQSTPSNLSIVPHSPSSHTNTNSNLLAMTSNDMDTTFDVDITKGNEQNNSEQLEMEPTSILPPLAELFANAEPTLNFPDCLVSAYQNDPFFRIILKEPEHYRNFTQEEELVLLKDNDRTLLCIPNATVDNINIREALIEQAHSILAHLGPRKTFLYLRDNFWWNSMRSDITKYIAGCRLCSTQKSRTQKPYGLMKSLEIPTMPWQTIGIDFVGPLPASKTRSGEFDMIMVIVDHLTHMVHLAPSKQNYRIKDIAELVFDTVYKLHGVPKAIVSDRDTYFTSTFWKQLHELIGVKLKMSTAYHPQSDGLTERMNKTIVQMIRHSINHKHKKWASSLPAIEFAINSATSDTTGFSPFYLNYGRSIGPILWNSHEELYPGVLRFAQQMKEAQILAHDAILTERVKQTERSNKRRRPAPFKVGDLVYLSTQNLSLPKGQSRKLSPKFIGPYAIVDEVSAGTTFKLQLPSSLNRRGIHPVFHASLLRIHTPNDDNRFPSRLYQPVQNLEYPEDKSNDEWQIQSITDHMGYGTEALFSVQWKSGDLSWLPYRSIKHLTALDSYLELHGIDGINQLHTPRISPHDSTSPIEVQGRDD